MNKQIENQFFNAYRDNSIVDSLIQLLKAKYFADNENEGLIHTDKEIQKALLKNIKEQIDSFDESVLRSKGENFLMQEIGDNLSGLPTLQEKECYLYSLLTEFKRISDILYYDEVFRQQNQERISALQKDRKYWENSDNKDEAEKQIKAIDHCLNDKIPREERKHKSMTDGFWHIATRPLVKDTFIEKAFRRFFGLMAIFADQLDALCLQHKINLFRLQIDCNVWIKHHRLTTDVSPYIGSIELARKYINELPVQETDIFETQQHKCLVKILQKEGAKEIFEKLLEQGYAEKAGDGYKWLKSKRLLAYFVEIANDTLNLRIGEKIQWGAFETVFECSDLRGAKNDYQKTGTLPVGYENIDKLLGYSPKK